MLVTDKHRFRQKPHPSAEWGRRAVEMAASIGKSKQDLARESGYTGGPKDPTIDRLARGQGSLVLAYAVKRTLKKWGLDVSQLPPLDGDADDDGGSMDDKLREAIEIVRRLWEVASDERFQLEVERLAELVRAHELVAQGSGQQRKLPPR